MTSRIIVEENITVKREAVAPKIEIFWNSRTNDANIAFWIAHEVSENGVFQRMEEDKRFEFRPMTVKLSNIAERVWDVPVGIDPQGNPLTVQVPTMLIMGAIKTALDVIYTERVIESETQPPHLPEDNNSTAPEAPVELEM